MSKKKSKPVARKAPNKAVKKKAVKKKATRKKTATSGAAARATATLAGAAPARRTKIATIFIFKTGNGTRIRTSPQRLFANPGDAVEFNVVNLIDGDADVPVTIVFPDGGPWGKEPFEMRNWLRKPTGDAPLGRYKYTITALDAEEDPELELPDGM